MVYARGPELTEEFRDELEVALAVLVPRNGCAEIARVCETVGSDGSEVRQLERRAQVLGDITACLAVRQLNPKPQTTRDDCNFLRLDIDDAELGCEPQRTELGDDQQLAVGIVEKTIDHRVI